MTPERRRSLLIFLMPLAALAGLAAVLVARGHPTNGQPPLPADPRPPSVGATAGTETTPPAPVPARPSGTPSPLPLPRAEKVAAARSRIDSAADSPLRLDALIQSLEGCRSADPLLFADLLHSSTVTGSAVALSPAERARLRGYLAGLFRAAGQPGGPAAVGAYAALIDQASQVADFLPALRGEFGAAVQEEALKSSALLNSSPALRSEAENLLGAIEGALRSPAGPRVFTEATRVLGGWREAGPRINSVLGEVYASAPHAEARLAVVDAIHLEAPNGGALLVRTMDRQASDRERNRAFSRAARNFGNAALRGPLVEWWAAQPPGAKAQPLRTLQDLVRFPDKEDVRGIREFAREAAARETDPGLRKSLESLLPK